MRNLRVGFHMQKSIAPSIAPTINSIPTTRSTPLIMSLSSSVILSQLLRHLLRSLISTCKATKATNELHDGDFKNAIMTLCNRRQCVAPKAISKNCNASICTY